MKKKKQWQKKEEKNISFKAFRAARVAVVCCTVARRCELATDDRRVPHLGTLHQFLLHFRSSVGFCLPLTPSTTAKNEAELSQE